MQQKSARATESNTTLKRYATSDVVGEDESSPLPGFPRCVCFALKLERELANVAVSLDCSALRCPASKLERELAHGTVALL